jgi:molybdopterin molybdotransferase
MLRGMLYDYPVDIIDYGIISDEPDALINFFKNSVKDVDLLITAGGTSMGRGDYVVEAISEIGRVYVHGVALFPSRPVVLAEAFGVPILGLPGYPVAAAISTFLFGDAIINRLLGIKGRKITPEVKGKLTRRAASKLGLRHYVRGKIEYRNGEIYIHPTITSGAGILTSLSLSDGYIVIHEDVEGYESGDEVSIKLYRRYVR